MGLVFGILSGVAFVVIIELLDNTIKTSHDIERNNLTVLGLYHR